MSLSNSNGEDEVLESQHYGRYSVGRAKLGGFIKVVHGLNVKTV